LRARVRFSSPAPRRRLRSPIWALLLLLVRHAAFDGVGRVLGGRAAGLRLSAAGRAQAGRLGAALAELPLAAVYSSPLQRALETATALAAPHALEPVLRARMTEPDFGPRTGRRPRALDADP